MTLKLKIPPPIIGVCCALCMWFIARNFTEFKFEFDYKGILVLFIALSGLMVDIAALIKFKSAETTINPLTPDKSSSLVISGIYQYSRNPMYLGLLLLLSAWALYHGNFLGFVVLPVFVYYITVFQIMPEELVMQQRFTDQYSAYKAKVRRWL